MGGLLIDRVPNSIVWLLHYDRHIPGLWAHNVHQFPLLSFSLKTLPTLSQVQSTLGFLKIMAPKTLRCTATVACAYFPHTAHGTRYDTDIMGGEACSDRGHGCSTFRPNYFCPGGQAAQSLQPRNYRPTSTIASLVSHNMVAQYVWFKCL